MSVLAELAIRARGSRYAARIGGSLDSFETQISAGADDAVEYLFTGSVALDGSPLPLGFDGAIGLAEGKTLVAFRFPGVLLAQGSPVALARLRLVSSNGNTTPVVLRVWCEAADNSAAITTASGSISAREKTTAFYDWSPAAWSVNQDDEATRTDALAPLVQEVVNRAGWASGNALTFLIELSPANTDTESPRRRAYSYEADPNASARVNINAIEAPEPPPPPPPGGFGDGIELFGVEGNEAYNPATPTLKDGTSVTGQMADDLAAYVYWRENQGSAVSSTRLASVLGGSNTYSVSRNGQLAYDTVARMFRMTGDLRDLDFMCGAFDNLQATFDDGGGQVAWSGCSVGGLIESCCGNDDPWSPYRKHLGSLGSGGTGIFTDLVRLNNIKLYAMIAEFAWMLHVNAGKTSPGSVNYATRLTYWKNRLEDHVKAWSEATSACWAVNNYKGVDGDSGQSGIPNVPSSRQRQAWGKYPYVTRDEGHAGWNTVMLHRYIGLLGLHAGLDIPNPADALAAAQNILTAIRANGSYKDCSNADHGDSLVMTWTNPFRGNTTTPMRMTYTGYLGATLLQVWLTGAYRTTWTLDDMRRLGSAFAWAHDGTSGATHGNITRGVAQCGLDAASDGGRSASDNSVRGMAALPIVFDPGGSKMSSVAANLVTLSGGATPDRAATHSALFLREALLAVGDLE